ncbi:SpoIID/LytB domain-containing protein [Bacillus sp. FJAT-29790]|nr:SpoIID/LytB domain-containing protein [Bacillus sp. FJAT-29790]
MITNAIIALLIVYFFPTSGEASGTSPSTSITYQTEVRVKLLPTSTISLKINGKYELVNLDSNELVPFTGTISAVQQNGRISVTANGEAITSTKGFNVNEVQASEENYVDISNINTASGLAPATYRGSIEMRPGTSSLELFNTLDMEDYLKGVVPSEMPASWHIEGLKAQAVAARSYANVQIQRNKQKGYLEMTVSNQVYGGKSKEHPRSTQAVQATAGIYATYNNLPIEAVFHSTSGGHTENSENVWKNPVPYLKAVPDPHDNNNGNYHYGWESLNYTDKIQEKLNLSPTQTLLSLKVTERGPSQSVKQMDAIVYDSALKSVTNIPLIPKYGASPDNFRSLFGISLKSVKFNVTSDSSVKIKMADGTEQSADYLKGYKIQRADDSVSIIEDMNISLKTPLRTNLVRTSPTSFTFKGDGWGHLLGMSQWGARGMAEAGYTYDQIIKHYYTGVEVKKIK